MTTFQEDAVMLDVGSSILLNDQTSDPGSSLPELFGQVEQLLNDAVAKKTGWAWEDRTLAIHIHDMVLSLRHMRHGLDKPQANMSKTSAGLARSEESDERAYFAKLLEEVERQGDFLYETMRSYLDDAVDGIAEVQSSLDSSEAQAEYSSKPIGIRKLQTAVHCLALQREPLQLFAARWKTKPNTIPVPILETPSFSGIEGSSTSEHEVEVSGPVESLMTDVGQEPVDKLPPPQAINKRTDTTPSRRRTPRLAELIKKRLTKSAFSKSLFLPQSDLDHLLNESNIMRELRKSGIRHDNKLVRFISNHAKKVFAILAYRGLLKYAGSLYACGFTDDYLPVDEKSHQLTSLNGFLGDEKALDWFLTWTKKEERETASMDWADSSDEEDTIDWDNITNFCDTQWIFLATVFGKASIFQPVHDRCPLPIIQYNEDVGGGGFSALHKGRIHPSHQVELISGDLIAIKQLKDEKSRAEKAYNLELNALEMVQKLNHDRIVKFFAGFEQHGQRYLMFQWVDGGNLREFWETQPWARNEETIKWALGEIKGLAEALKSWHNWDSNPESQRFCRHGDLKPENIVRDQSGGGLGKFLIADMGLAKTHSQPTHKRRIPSTGLHGTLRYQAPELNKLFPQISRSVDIWSFGCIMLEFIIWLLYGYEALHNFNTALSGQSNWFYKYDGSDFQLHPIVLLWIKHMRQSRIPIHGPSISHAIGDMLQLVCTRILIQDSERRNSTLDVFMDDPELDTESKVATIITPSVDDLTVDTAEISRAKIGEVCDALAHIAGNSEPGYIYDPDFSIDAQYDGGPKSMQLSPHSSSQSFPGLPGQSKFARLSLDSGFGSEIAASASSKFPYIIPDLSDTWDIFSDNQFAHNVFRSFYQNDISGTLPTEASYSLELCESCSNKDGGVLFGRGFSSLWSEIKVNRHSCALCSILADTSTPDAQLTYYRNGSSLATSKNGTPIWSLVVGPGATNAPADIQRGFPLLPESGGPVQAELLRKWVQDCDENHSCGTKGRVYMPTRLIDLQAKIDHDELKLDCSKIRVDERYVALSHRWGDQDKHKSICLLTDNLEQWQRYISLSKLPQMFQDAVKVTRQLGMRYLWIDSLCIVQDSQEDWKAECQKMEAVFSFANVTISATCSSGVKESFLDPDTVENFRHRRAYPLDMVGEDNKTTRFYLCDAIDDFRGDVEESELSTRGWVFQERALSRRIIHFTKSQLYWECGGGIRSETLNRLFNSKSAFMSDPEFPTSMASQYKGMRIEFFKEIYRRYSELNFTYETDRSLGIAGIERRLERVFKATAFHGILNNPNDPSYLRRSLLWRSPIPYDEQSRGKNFIKYPIDRKVPTWSWMAVKGPIEYMPAPFGEMDWNMNLGLEFDTMNERNEKPQPTGVLETFMLPLGRPHPDDDMSFDYHGLERSSEVRCILIGTERSGGNHQKHYILIIAPSKSDNSFERIGVAIIHREFAWMAHDYTTVRIV